MARYRDDYDEPVVVIERDRDAGGSIGMLLLGLAIGAGAALLFAPASGEETRERLRVEARRARKRVREVADEFGDDLVDRVERTREKLDHNLSSVRESVTDRARGLADAVEAGRDAALQARAELERSVAETKRAYADARRQQRNSRPDRDSSRPTDTEADSTEG